MDVTAIVLCRDRYDRAFEGLEVLVHRAHIRDAAELQAARWAAMRKVQTSHFFFLDDDDDLPDDYQVTIARCKAANVAMAYTDELIRTPDGTDTMTTRGPYSQAAHLANPLLVHHLVLCDTAQAWEATNRLPLGHYCPELLLYWQLAKAGAEYIDAVGYVWNKGHGMHTWPVTMISQVRATLWCRENP